MKIFHTADWHIGKTLKNYSLLQDQKYVFDNFIEDLKSEKPDALIISGDLYDRSIPSAEAICLLNDILCKIVFDLKIKTFIISGNHDSRERLSFVGELLEKSDLYIAGTLSKEVKKVIIGEGQEQTNIYLMPFIEPYSVKSLYQDKIIKTHDDAVKVYTQQMLDNLDDTQINFLVAHGLFRIGGDKIDEETSVGGSDMVDAKIFIPFDYVALGHLHSHMSIGSEKMLYAGSPLKYSVDEASQQKSYTIITYTNKDDMKIETRKFVPLRDVRIIEGTFKELCNRENFSNLDDYVFANITDENTAFNSINSLKAIFPNILGLKYINQNSHNIDENIQNSIEVNKKSEVELFCDFYKTSCDEEISDDDIDVVTKIFDELKINLKGEVTNDSD